MPPGILTFPINAISASAVVVGRCVADMLNSAVADDFDRRGLFLGWHAGSLVLPYRNRAPSAFAFCSALVGIFLGLIARP